MKAEEIDAIEFPDLPDQETFSLEEAQALLTEWADTSDVVTGVANSVMDDLGLKIGCNEEDLGEDEKEVRSALLQLLVDYSQFYLGTMLVSTKFSDEVREDLDISRFEESTLRMKASHERMKSLMVKPSVVH